MKVKLQRRRMHPSLRTPVSVRVERTCVWNRSVHRKSLLGHHVEEEYSVSIAVERVRRTRLFFPWVGRWFGVKKLTFSFGATDVFEIYVIVVPGIRFVRVWALIPAAVFIFLAD